MKQDILRSWQIFFWECFLFSLTLILGILTASRLGNYLVVKETAFFVNIVPPSAALPQAQPLSAASHLSLFQFLLYFLFGLFIIFFIIFVLKSKKIKKIIFKTLFVLTTGLGGVLTLSVWQPGLISLFIMGVLIFLWLQTESILIHNLLLILGISGMASATGLRIAPWTGVVILAVFSLYDYLAVYKTKHMISMAREMMEQGAVLAAIVPQQSSDFGARLAEVKPGGKFIILGGGDMAFPLLFAVSLMPEGIINSIIVAAFSLLGLCVSLWLFLCQKNLRPIPALPAIAFFSMIGFLITLIV